MPGMDVFKADGFSMEELTAAVNRQDFLPARLLELGTFQPVSTRATTVSIERYQGVLRLVQSSPRGAPAETRAKNKRELVTVQVPRLALEDDIMADEVQGIRAFGSQSELMQVGELVNRRALELRRDIEFTCEYHRLGAINGVVLDADGSTLLNLSTLFGGSANSTVYLDFANNKDGALRAKIEDSVVYPILDAVKLPFANLRIRALCGRGFWKALIANDEVRHTFLTTPQADWLRRSTITGEFEFGGVIWESYKGSDTTTNSAGNRKTVRVTDDECRFFPENVPGLFQQVFAPADYNETVNTPGLPFYAKQAVDPLFQKWTKLEVQSNCMCICTIPEVLFKGDKDAS